MSDSPTGGPTEPDKQLLVPDTSLVGSAPSVPASAEAGEAEAAAEAKSTGESSEIVGEEAKTEAVAIGSSTVTAQAPETENGTTTPTSADADASTGAADALENAPTEPADEAAAPTVAATAEPAAIAEPPVTESDQKTTLSTGSAEEKAESADAEHVVTESVDAEAVATESAKAESPAPETVATESAKAESAAPETVATESAKAESATPETVATESAKAESATPETVATESAKADSAAKEAVAVDSAEVAASGPQETGARKSGSLAGIAPPGEEHAPLTMQILAGIVTAVSNREVDLTLDDGRAAVIHRENFDLAGTDPTTVLQVGDGAEGAVLSREDPQKRVVLSRKWVMRDRAWKKAAESIADHSTINCKITGASKKGIVVDMMGLRGFVPLNHFQMGSEVPAPDTVGQMVELRVLAADRQKDRLLLSRRSALMKEQRKRENEAFQSLKVGQTYTGVVNDLTAFGAFVTVNEVRGLLHVSEMSWDRVSSPKGLVEAGQEIQVQVIELKAKKRRVSFSIKALIPDPLAMIEIGSVHSGTVKRLVDYGVFVDIGPTEGMVHLSELAEYRPSHPSEIVLRGDEVQVKVLKVNREKRRVELSMRQALYFTA